MKALTICLFALLGLAASASAEENYREKNFNAESREKFEAVAADVRKEMEPGGRYQYVRPDERRKVDQKLGEMGALFEQSPSAADMSESSKIALYNAQEVVNSILTRRDGDRVICSKTAPVGSHIPVVSCHTYAQEEQARRGTRDELDKWTRRGCLTCGSGSLTGGTSQGK